MKELTERQRAILSFIQDFMQKEAMPPTITEIAAHFQIKTSTVFTHIIALQKKSVLTRTAKARDLRLAASADAEEARLTCRNPLVPCAKGAFRNSRRSAKFKALLNDRIFPFRIPNRNIRIPTEFDMRPDDLALLLPVEDVGIESNATLWQCAATGEYRFASREGIAREVLENGDASSWRPIGVLVGFQRAIRPRRFLP